MVPDVRKGQGDVKLSREEFARRLGERFSDPAFDPVRADLDRIIDVPTARSRRRPSGWSSPGEDYPRHLAGRAFAVVVHGDTEGTDVLRRSLTDWLIDMELV